MKYKIYLLLIIVIVVLLIIFIPDLFYKNITNIKIFRFSYTTGYAMNSDTKYEVTCADKCYVSIKLYGESDSTESEITSENVLKLQNILNKYKVSKWNGFQKVDKKVLDGNSFSLSISSDTANVTASGYMKYPSNYKKCRTELDEFFSNLRK